MGSKIVEEAGTTMHEVVGAVDRVKEIVADIAGASREQATGVEQVAQAVTKMDEVTQQNAALVEEAAAAAGSLEQQIGSLSEAVNAFRSETGQGEGAKQDLRAHYKVEEHMLVTGRPH